VDVIGKVEWPMEFVLWVLEGRSKLLHINISELLVLLPFVLKRVNLFTYDY
jgi:hypothetical protein